MAAQQFMYFFILVVVLQFGVPYQLLKPSVTKLHKLGLQTFHLPDGRGQQEHLFFIVFFQPLQSLRTVFGVQSLPLIQMVKWE